MSDMLFTILELGGAGGQVAVPYCEFYSIGEKRMRKIDRSVAEQIAARFASEGLRLPVDIRHQSLDPKTHAPAVGWITDVRAEADKLALSVDWTDKGRAMVEGKEYGYFSPVIAWDAPHRRTGAPGVGLHSMALTNTPNLTEIKPLVMEACGLIPNREESKMKWLRDKLASLGVSLPENSSEDVLKDGLDKAITALEQRIPAALAKDLGHAGEGSMTVAEAQAAVGKLREPKVPSELGLVLGGKPELTVAEAITAAGTIKAQAPDAAKLAALEAEVAGMRRSTLEAEINGFISAGQLNPAEKNNMVAVLESTTPGVADAMRKLIAGRKPSGPAAPALGAPGAPGDAEISALEAKFDAQLGVKKEDK